MSLSATLTSRINALQTASADLEVGKAEINNTHTIQYGDGAGANQANVIWSDRRTLAASASESLDLAGSLSGLLGAAVFARVKYIEIRAAAGNTNSVVVTRPENNGVPFVTAEHKIFPDIPPGGRATWGDPGATGVVVTASSGDLISIANGGSGTSVEYEIIIIGAAT